MNAPVPGIISSKGRRFTYVEGDPYWDQVVLLMHFDTTPFIDEKGHTVSALTSSATGKFGTAISSNSTQGNLVTSSSSDFALGTGDFTIEAWIFLVSAGQDIRLWQPGTGDIPAEIQSNTRKLSAYNGGAITGGSAVPLGEWVHIAFSRQSGVLYAALNGAVQWSAAFTSDFTQTSWMAYSNSYVNLYYMDELRVTKGVARYTSDFTPPTEVFYEHGCVYEYDEPEVNTGFHNTETSIYEEPTPSFTPDEAVTTPNIYSLYLPEVKDGYVWSYDPSSRSSIRFAIANLNDYERFSASVVYSCAFNGNIIQSCSPGSVPTNKALHSSEDTTYWLFPHAILKDVNFNDTDHNQRIYPDVTLSASNPSRSNLFKNSITFCDDKVFAVSKDGELYVLDEELNLLSSSTAITGLTHQLLTDGTDVYVVSYTNAGDVNVVRYGRIDTDTYEFTLIASIDNESYAGNDMYVYHSGYLYGARDKLNLSTGERTYLGISTQTGIRPSVFGNKIGFGDNAAKEIKVFDIVIQAVTGTVHVTHRSEAEKFCLLSETKVMTTIANVYGSYQGYNVYEFS